MSIQLISRAADGTLGDGDSFVDDISADGRYVLFSSVADNLGGPTTLFDVYVADRETGDVQRVNLAADGTPGAGSLVGPRSIGGSISDDGRFVLFRSDAPELVAGDTNREFDVFLKDLQTGAISRVSTASDGTQGNDASFVGDDAVSADGRFVVFSSRASNLVAGDSNGREDVFLKDLQTGEVTLISAAVDGTAGTGTNAVISADGRFVAFESSGTNLVAGDTNGLRDIFVKDLQTGVLTRVSTSADGAQATIAFDPFEFPLGNVGAAISADGRYVVFKSDASNLVPGDTQDPVLRAVDVFRKDLQTGAISRVNTDADGVARGEDNDRTSSIDPQLSISADGRYVAFASVSNFLVPNDNRFISDVFVKDVQTGEITRVSVSGDGTQSNGGSQGAALSADGRTVAFDSFAENLVAGDTNESGDAFVVDVADVVTPPAPIRGTPGDDVLTGGPRADTVFGLAGDDTLSGRDGVDELYGGVGDDSLAGGSGDDTLFDSGLRDRRFESGTGNDTLDGGGGDDQLFGGDGANVVNGGSGDDTIDCSKFDLTGSDTIRGGSGDDSLIAGDGDDVVSGGVGDDYISSNDGDDTIDGGEGNDLIFGRDGANVVNGGSGDDTLDVGLGDDSLFGGDGADVLVGGAGQDTLRGGGEADIYRFLDLSESPRSAPDVIAGFHGAGARAIDVVDLAGIDADATRAGNQAFTFLGAAAAFTAAGQIRLVDDGDSTLLLANVDAGLRTAEFAILILDGDAASAADYTAADFIL